MADTALKLLIVDDESSTRSLLEQIFARMGHSVRSAEDGFSALEQIREAKPDVLLSDLNMPGMSGFELLSVVRRRLPGIYVIATSGAYKGAEVPHGIAADAFYEKATGFASLVKLMETVERGEPRARSSEDTTPIWIPRAGEEPTGEAYAMISCPECLRAFPQVLGSSPLTIQTIHKTECVYCHTAIRYAIVQPLDPATSQPYAMKVEAVGSDEAESQAAA